MTKEEFYEIYEWLKGHVIVTVPMGESICEYVVWFRLPTDTYLDSHMRAIALDKKSGAAYACGGDFSDYSKTHDKESLLTYLSSNIDTSIWINHQQIVN